MSRVSISVPDAIVDDVERQVGDGRFRTVDEFFEEAIRSDRDQRRLTFAELRERLDSADRRRGPISAAFWMPSSASARFPPSAVP